MSKFTIPFLLLLTACPNDTANATDTDTDTDADVSGSESMSATSMTTESADSSTGEPTTMEPTTDPIIDTSTGDDTTGDTTGSGGTGLDCFELEQVFNNPEGLEAQCEKHPWGRPPECSSPFPTPSCQEMIEIIIEHEPCSDIDLCDYILCADALADAPCEKRPSTCEPIVDCLNETSPTPASALEQVFAGFLRFFKFADAT